MTTLRTPLAPIASRTGKYATPEEARDLLAKQWGYDLNRSDCNRLFVFYPDDMSLDPVPTYEQELLDAVMSLGSGE